MSCGCLCYLDVAMCHAKLETPDTQLIKHLGIFATGVSGMIHLQSHAN
jgi:hypothetical protein